MNPSLILQESTAIAAGVGRSYVHILPYLALSIPLAVTLKRTNAASSIRRGLGANPLAAVFTSTVVGALSPFCSCGVIPIITSLLLGGVPLAPVMSFWLASPSMDPEIFMLSAGSIGWELAVWRLAATFVMSLGAGLTVLYLAKKGWLSPDILRPSLLGQKEEESSGQARGTQKSACGCGSKSKWAGLRDDAAGLALRLSMFMLIAFLLEALILRYVPQRLIASHLGSQSAWSVPLATFISIPMYTTNLTSLGMISALIQGGMDQGAALAFLIGGAVTTLPAMSAVYGVVRWRVFALYLGFCVSGALLAGYAYQFANLPWR